MKAFSSRAFVSVLTGLSLIGMTISGIVLFLTPSGRIANWTDWTYLRLTKHQWGALHIWLSLIFLAASFFHVYFNWSNGHITTGFWVAIGGFLFSMVLKGGQKVLNRE